MNRLKWIILAAAAFVVEGCEKGLIPVLITDAVDGVELPQYTPIDSGSKASVFTPYLTYGTDGTRINAPELNIKYAYNSSDEITHIVLRGKLNNGIAEGLLWSEDTAGNFGVPSGTYGGRGDFKIGSLSALRPEATGGSVAIGSLDFDSEWVMGDFYTAVVLHGIIDDNKGVTVTETNESLRLFSKQYRNTHYPDEATFFEVNGKIQRKNTYTYNPNEFHPWPDPGPSVPEPYNSKPGAPRGGYYILISGKAHPQTAFLEVAYADGSKKKIEIDYSEVELREEIPLTSIAFQDPSPAVDDAGTYSVTKDEVDPLLFAVNDVNPSDIYNTSLTPDTVTTVKPLYLRPLYEPVDIDPKKTTTNMISKISVREWDDSTILKDNNLVAEWDDSLQAINVYYKSDPSTTLQYQGMVIHAALRKTAFTAGGMVNEIVCRITFANANP